MKKFRLLIIISCMLCGLLMLSACEKVPTLTTPTDLEMEMTTLTLTWGEVKDARLYMISIQKDGEEAKEFAASKTAYSLTHLDEGHYQIKVKAIGKEDVIKDSEWSEVLPFEREREPGMVFALNEDQTAYTVVDKGVATGDIVIPDTYRDKPVTSIGKKAFFNKSDVTSISFGANITSIGEFAFANCSYLTSVKFSDGLTSMGDSAFASCRLLAGKIVLPEGLTEIPNNAFAYCAQISGVTFGSRVHTIGKNAFTDCKGLTEIILPDSVNTIGDYAFATCTNVTSVTLGKGVEYICPCAFSTMPKITSIVLPDGVKKIGEGAFLNDEALKDVTIGTKIEMIDLGAFLGTALWNNTPENEVYVGKWFLGLKDTQATTVTFRPDTVGIANFAFYQNRSLTDIILPDSVKIIGGAAFANAAMNNIVIGSGVEVIGEQAFVGCKNLSTVILGSYDFNTGTMAFSSLKRIENYAFRECASLFEIQIPDTVEMIGTYAFRDTGMFNRATDGVVYAGNWLVDFTEKLTGDVTVKNKTVGIANYAFYNCTTLTGISLPNSVKRIGRSAFYQCSQLIFAELPDTLEVIEEYTFYKCTSLKLFALPPAIRSIGRSAFYKCASTQDAADQDTDSDTFVIPDGVEYIGDYAFYGCGVEIKGLTDGFEGLEGMEGMEGISDSMVLGVDILMIGSGVKHIGNNAFAGFVSLKRVVIGNGVETIGEKAFYKCNNLEEVVFSTSLREIGEKAFYKCSALKSVLLPDSVTTIGHSAFYKCEAVSKVDLGEGLTEIGNYAFYACGEIRSLLLPKTLTTIGKQAFRNCKGLTSLVIGDQVSVVDEHAFYGCNALTLYAEAKEPAEGWAARWNSSYRPVIWGCTLSEDKDYVVSLEKTAGTILNLNASNTISAPQREGYTFVGWGVNSSATTAAYTPETLGEAADGRRLYVIWSDEAPEA